MLPACSPAGSSTQARCLCHPAPEQLRSVFDLRRVGFVSRTRLFAAICLAVVFVACLASRATAAEEPRAFLFLKTGERFATQEVAGPTVTALTKYLGDRLGRSDLFAPRILNEPVVAAEWAGRIRPAAGIVTPGFYLAYGKQLGLEPLLETQREGITSERYVLLARQTGPKDLNGWQGKTIATPLASEQRYVTGVILEGKFGDEMRLRYTPDIEGTLLDMADAGAHASDLALIEEAAWKTFGADPELGGKLQVIMQSAELPRDLVVIFRPNLNGIDSAKVKQTIETMDTDDAGRAVLRSIRVSRFSTVDSNRLERARTLFLGK
jgi:hypothetical protein